MPPELLLDAYGDYHDSDEVEETVIEETDIISVYRLEEATALAEELDVLKLILLDNKATIDDKNKAYDKIRDLEKNKAEEKLLEDQIDKNLNYKAFVKIKDNNISVIVRSKTHNVTLANKIMNLIQKNYKENKYISVKFE